MTHQSAAHPDRRSQEFAWQRGRGGLRGLLSGPRQMDRTISRLATTPWAASASAGRGVGWTARSSGCAIAVLYLSGWRPAVCGSPKSLRPWASGVNTHSGAAS